jgi:diguanylate cyclase (GGDEF)-like protein/PAS domain S-box-containing protein
MHGQRPEDLIGKHVSTFMPEGWRPVDGRPREIRSWKRETVNVRKDGSVFPVQLLSDAVRDRDGTPLAFVTCTEEITERKRAEEALRSSEARYRRLFEGNLAGVYRATLDGRLLEWNAALARILGYASREELTGKSLGDLTWDRRERSESVGRLRQGGALTNVERRMRRKDGAAAWVLESQRLLAGDEGEDRVEAILVDITDRKEYQQRMEHQALHDPLTGLHNRAFLEQRLEQLVSQGESGLAVMFVDLDRFKFVNDSHGHAVGDAMLREAAVRLHDSVRADDLVARVGGDEFVLLLPRVQAVGAARIARTILRRMREPFVVDGQRLHSSSSVGIALFPEDGKDVQELLVSADAAMYRAKASGRDAFQFCGDGDRNAGQR